MYFQSLGLRKDERKCHDPCRKKTGYLLHCKSGLPDDIFSLPTKIPIRVHIGGPWKENVNIFHDH
jgi:hypothetical protein